MVSLGLHKKSTGRHAMRLVNLWYGQSTKFFWDERATSLEDQTTQPIREHIEMGYSGKGGDPTFEDLISNLEDLEHYECLFSEAFGNNQISEKRIQLALAQFIRSMQSFDSRYDVGRAQANSDDVPFYNFTDQENEGKRLYMSSKSENGADCQNCHRAPVFDIDPGSSINGVVGVAGDPTSYDYTNTRSPTLRTWLIPRESLMAP